MTLRPEYSLGHSQYNDFLFASISLDTGSAGEGGVESHGDDLTVLSALSRLDVDPWREAARLSDLSRDEAAGALAATLARLPDASWKAADAPANAARLVAMLPDKSAPAIPPVSAAGASPAARARFRLQEMLGTPPPIGDSAPARKPALKWLVWLTLAVAAWVIFTHFQPDNNFEPEPPPRAGTTQQR